VLGDRGLLFEATVNLVDNAIKFGASGGHVQIEVVNTEAEVTLAVTDDGPGIAPEEREAVLRRFFRSDRSRSRPGTGLGLSLVAAIARLHGCKLGIEDGIEGQGCRIVLRCPRAVTDDGSSDMQKFGSVAVLEPDVA
jgi:signal transduction histidine kinase